MLGNSVIVNAIVKRFRYRFRLSRALPQYAAACTWRITTRRLLLIFDQARLLAAKPLRKEL